MNDKQVHAIIIMNAEGGSAHRSNGNKPSMDLDTYKEQKKKLYNPKEGWICYIQRKRWSQVYVYLHLKIHPILSAGHTRFQGSADLLGI